MNMGRRTLSTKAGFTCFGKPWPAPAAAAVAWTGGATEPFSRKLLDDARWIQPFPIAVMIAT
jgi:hypothetical protein